jgi:hypothetical protein
MDPIIIGVIVVLIVLLAMRMFFGLAKTVIKLAAVVVIAIVIWRLVQGQ